MKAPAASILRQLADRIRAGDKLLTAWVGSTDTAVAETLVAVGFDAAVFDMQHGTVDLASTLAGIAAVALHGKPSLVRVAVGDFATAARLCDAGAAGIIAPMIGTSAEAQAFVDFIKFPPVGGRSWGPRRALMLTGLDETAYLARANDFHLAIAMIETREGYRNLDAILGVAGIDGVFVGPADLSIALSAGARLAPTGSTIEAELDNVAAWAKAHGKFAATFCHDGARAKAMLARGYSLCSAGTDARFLRLGAQAELAVAR